MIAEQIAKDLLSIEAVSLSPDEPFTWASGLKSPIYCDNRVTMSYPEVRRAIAQGLAANSSCCLGSRNSRFTNGLYPQ
jgi:orotate phosphoribosyltransferase